MSGSLPEGTQHVQRSLAEALDGARLVPVITLEHEEDAVPLARALREGGLRVLEFTLRTSAGLGGLARVRTEFPDLCLAAGTVRCIEEYHQAIRAGADFVVSPGSTSRLLDYGALAEIPLLPGISTISELMTGFEKGYRLFKFFPAVLSGGLEAVRAIAGPFPDVRLVPTGGIRADNAAAYLAEPNVIALGGTWLSPSELVRKRDWAGLQQLAETSLSAL